MCFFTLALKRWTEVVSLRYLGRLFQNVIPGKEIVFSPYIFVFIFTGWRSFYFLCHGHVFDHFDKIYHLWLPVVSLVDESTFALCSKY